MAPNILPLKDINLNSKDYTIHALVVEKGMPKISAKTSSQYQRLVLQDIEVTEPIIRFTQYYSYHLKPIKILKNMTTQQGTRIQATIFGNNIRIFQNTLELYGTYSISNATVTTTLEQFRFLDQKCQLTITGRSPVEEKKVDGLTQRSVKFDFTSLADVGKIKDPDQNLG